MTALPQRPQRPIPATLQEKYFIDAMDVLWLVLEELRGVREELRAARLAPEANVQVVNISKKSKQI